MDVREVRLGDRLILYLSGELDARSAHHLTDRVERLDLDDGPGSITIDLAGLQFLDSSGLSALISLRRRADDASLRFEVVSVRPTQRQLIDIVGLIDLLAVEDEA